MLIPENKFISLSYLLASNNFFKRLAIDAFQRSNENPDCTAINLAKMVIKSEIVCEIAAKQAKKYESKSNEIAASIKSIKDIRKNKCKKLEEKAQEIETLKRKIKGIQSEIEQSTVQGFNYFKEVFDECLSVNYRLLRSVCMTQKTDNFFHRTFINYRFFRAKQARDFSVLFFAYWLFDLYCDENPDMSNFEKKIKAQKIVDAAYIILTNKDYSKYPIGQVLFSLFSNHLNQDSLYLYFSCLIEYIQAVYHSKALAEEERFEIYKLFGWGILRINNLLTYSTHYDAPIFKEKPLELEKKTVVKKIDNSLYQCRNKENTNKEIVQLFVELKSAISNLLKNYPNIPNYPEKTCTKKCAEILLKIDEILDMCDESEEIDIFNKLRAYNHLYFINSEYKKINFWAFVIQNAYFQIYNDTIRNKNILKKYCGNIYLDILTTFPSSRRKKRLYKRIRTLIKSTMEEAKYPIYFEGSKYGVERNKTDRIDLDFLKLPILTFKVHKKENIIVLKRMLFIYGY